MARAWNGHAWVEMAKPPKVNRAKLVMPDPEEIIRKMRLQREARELVEAEDREREIRRMQQVAAAQDFNVQANRQPPAAPEPADFDDFFLDDADEPDDGLEEEVARVRDEPGVIRVDQPFALHARPGGGINWADMQIGGAPQRLNPWKQQPAKAEEIMAKPMPFDRTERTTRMPRFKVKYATGEEFKLRLENTIVTVNDDLVFVRRVDSMRNHLGGMCWGCMAIDSDGDQKALLFEENGLNLRSPDPGYIQIDNFVYHMKRKPARVYKQGLMAENTVFRQIDSDRHPNLFGNLALHFLLKALNDRPVIRYDPALLENKKALRLSDRIAIVAPGPKSKRTKVEHLGFDIGTLHGSTVLSDHVTMWAERACEQVGLTLKQK